MRVPTTAPIAMLRYALDAFVISTQPRSTSGIQPQMTLQVLKDQVT
jgi:hypothetical protein